MAEIIDRRRGIAAAASLVIAGLLTACSQGPSGPAPVYIGGTGPTSAMARPPMTAGPPPPQRVARAVLPPLVKGPPPKIAKTSSDVIPLDAAPRNPAPAVEPPSATSAPPPSSPPGPGGRFPWPVHGRVLANYGSSTGGPHNDGVNIAAPLGTPVRSIDAGTVAYVGNEIKGYGNLVLIKHANGWISAYAHLGEIAVKKGDSVGAGQVIAKVGETGGVGEPQLHFELRRGTKPVDPKEFLEPAAKTI